MNIDTSFESFFKQKKPLERPFRFSFEKDLCFKIKSKDDSFDQYYGFSNEDFIRDSEFSIKYSKREYIIDFPKGTYQFTLYPEYTEDHLTVILRKHGATLNKVKDFPYIIFGNPNLAPTLIFANIQGYDYLSSFVLNGFIQAIISKGLSNRQNCFIVVPNLKENNISRKQLVDKYSQSTSNIIELSGQFNSLNTEVKTSHPLNKSTQEQLKNNLSNIEYNYEDTEDNQDNSNAEMKELIKQVSSYTSIELSYRSIDPNQTESFGELLASILLK